MTTPKTSKEIYQEYRSHIAIAQNKRNKDTRKSRKEFYGKKWLQADEVIPKDEHNKIIKLIEENQEEFCKDHHIPKERVEEFRNEVGMFCITKCRKHYYDLINKIFKS